MHFNLSEEQELLRQTVREFAEKEVAPKAAEMDEKEDYDWSLWDKMAELGLTGIPFPEEYGGAGMDHLSYAIAVEELSRVCASTAQPGGYGDPFGNRYLHSHIEITDILRNIRFPQIRFPQDLSSSKREVIFRALCDRSTTYDLDFI